MGNRRCNNSGAVPSSNPASGVQGEAAGRHLPQLKLIREKTPIIPGETSLVFYTNSATCSVKSNQHDFEHVTCFMR